MFVDASALTAIHSVSVANGGDAIRTDPREDEG